MQLDRCYFRPKTRSSVLPHRHDGVEWHWVLGGRCGFRLGADIVPLRPGDLLMVPPDLPHGVVMGAGGDWLLQYICDTSGEDPDLLHAWRERAGTGLVLPAGEGRHAFFAALTRDACSDDRWRRRSAGLRFHALICEAIAGTPTELHPAVGSALAFLQRRLRCSCRLDEIAAAAGCDKNHLTRLFRRQLGTTPVRYHQHLRLELAASLLRDGDLTVAAVAERIGFEDPFHFSRAFRRWSGHPPSRLLPEA